MTTLESPRRAIAWVLILALLAGLGVGAALLRHAAGEPAPIVGA